MPILNFSDGLSINTDGEYRVIHASDGCYVVGHGFLISVDTWEEGNQLIDDLRRQDALDGKPNG